MAKCRGDDPTGGEAMAHRRQGDGQPGDEPITIRPSTRNAASVLVPVGVVTSWWSTAESLAAPLQAMEPSVVLGAPGVLRAAVAFGAVLILGGLLRLRAGGFVDRAIDAASAHPLRAMLYGVAAHVVLAFAGVYLATRLSQFALAGVNLAPVGLALGGLLLLGVAALGFAVVGSVVANLVWDRTAWTGLVVGGLIAAGLAGLDPVVGGVLWLVVVSMGIGGAVSRWLHASMVPAE